MRKCGMLATLKPELRIFTQLNAFLLQSRLGTNELTCAKYGRLDISPYSRLSKLLPEHIGSDGKREGMREKAGCQSERDRNSRYPLI